MNSLILSICSQTGPTSLALCLIFQILGEEGVRVSDLGPSGNDRCVIIILQVRTPITYVQKTHAGATKTKARLRLNLVSSFFFVFHLLYVSVNTGKMSCWL